MSQPVIHYQQKIKELQKDNVLFTEIRLAIIEVLKTSEKPLCSREILKLVHEYGCKAHRATVYRDLDWLVSQGLANAYSFKDQSVIHYEIVTDDHHHFVCEECGLIQIMRPQKVEKAIKELENDLERQTGFHAITHRFKLYGLCKECFTK